MLFHSTSGIITVYHLRKNTSCNNVVATTQCIVLEGAQAGGAKWMLQALHMPNSYYSKTLPAGWRLVVLDTTEMSLHSGYPQARQLLMQHACLPWALIIGCLTICWHAKAQLQLVTTACSHIARTFMSLLLPVFSQHST
jgi:hypothetical protein